MSGKGLWWEKGIYPQMLSRATRTRLTTALFEEERQGRPHPFPTPWDFLDLCETQNPTSECAEIYKIRGMGPHTVREVAAAADQDLAGF